MVQFTQALAAALLASSAVAHPGHPVSRDILRRQAHLDHPERRELQSCKRSLVDSGWVREQHMRREARLHELRVAAGFAKPGDLVRRDPVEAEENFGQSTGSCTIDPESTEGPYWVEGELIRQDLLTGQEGAVTHLDINIVDVSNCEPVTDAYVEMWGANATGVYTGVQAKGNGDGGPSSLTSNALRGLQPTGPNGTASFITLIPGHYVGRANHLHTIIHQGATVLPNNTIAGGTISHVGQFYVEQNFLSTVEATAPYNTNKQAHMLNTQDFLFIMARKGTEDPVMNITLIGKTIADGLYATMDVGINPKARQSPQPVNTWTSTGGVPVPGSPWVGYPDKCKYCWPGAKKQRNAAPEAEAEQ